MPVYHFTFHAYGTWLPNRPEGSYRYKQGWQPPGHARAETYRKQMTDEPARFTTQHQQLLLNTLRKGEPLQNYELYGMASDESHLHAVIAWRDNREPARIRSQIKSSMTRAMNQRFGKRKWFVRSAGWTPIEDEEHLHHLIHAYLPKHDGLYWHRWQKAEQA